MKIQFGIFHSEKKYSRIINLKYFGMYMIGSTWYLEKRSLYIIRNKKHEFDFNSTFRKPSQMFKLGTISSEELSEIKYVIDYKILIPNKENSRLYPLKISCSNKLRKFLCIFLVSNPCRYVVIYDFLINYPIRCCECCD